MASIANRDRRKRSQNSPAGCSVAAGGGILGVKTNLESFSGGGCLVALYQ